MYLELPVNVQARGPVADKIDVLFAVGPYFAYGVGGKASYDGINYTESESIFGKNKLKRFDAGLGVGLLFEASKVIFGLEGQLGLTAIGDGAAPDDSPKNINFDITIGYKF